MILRDKVLINVAEDADHSKQRMQTNSKFVIFLDCFLGRFVYFAIYMLNLLHNLLYYNVKIIEGNLGKNGG